MAQILNRRNIMEGRYPAVHGDSGFAMVMVPEPTPVVEAAPVENKDGFTECKWCHCITDKPCTDAPAKGCWEDWAELLADAPGG